MDADKNKERIDELFKELFKAVCDKTIDKELPRIIRELAQIPFSNSNYTSIGGSKGISHNLSDKDLLKLIAEDAKNAKVIFKIVRGNPTLGNMHLTYGDDFKFIAYAILSNPEMLYFEKTNKNGEYLSLIDSRMLKGAKEELEKLDFPISKELEKIIDEAIERRIEGEKNNKLLFGSNKESRSVAMAGKGNEVSDRRSSSKTYIQKGGALTHLPVYGGKNLGR